MLKFGQDISFVALVIVGMITDLHLAGKPMFRPVQATWPTYPEHRFSSVTKSILRWNIRIWTGFYFGGTNDYRKHFTHINMGNNMLRLVEATWSKYPQRLCFSVNKPNIEM